ncbi:uncharacterized protein LOC123886091 [Trifolium pratense]|uniref:uncharacterized protein LOC123886091 n=1 Tax=Trifolium pratense TaxID=57577 RepID=UPI001E696F65|nr:uncharacterized protein LOC123886091 [Trifolium pratense]
MDTLIPNTQSAFLKGRQLVEGVVVVNEVIDFAKKSGKECLILKVDFEKAYDSVDWGFLEYMLGRFGFSVKWRNWMKACVCVGNLSILVNGSPTEEIQIKRGLKQGAPLAPLLFLLVAEGLGGLMRKAVEINQFRPFLALKAVLRGFEMTSGLKMNFWKSCVMCVNVSDEFLGMASDFLNCRIGRTPFKYLGLPVGANPHADESVAGIGENSTCFPLGRAIKTKQNKTCWVKWEEICKPKKEGGLGIRDLRFVNVSLLAKWRWKLLSHDCELWKDIVISRYGSDVVGKKNLGEADITRLGSIWWKDLCLLDSESKWFIPAVEKRVEMGDSTNFWNDVWVGNQTLHQKFPRLFGISTQQNEVIQNLGSVADGQWRWDLQWRRNLFVWEEEQYNVLIELIAPFVPNDQHDKWMWLRNGMEGFTVNFAYLLVVSAYSNQRVCDSLLLIIFGSVGLRRRNDCVFNNGVLNVGEVVEQVKVLSWKWFVGRVAKGPCLLYEWRWSPLECMPRG